MAHASETGDDNPSEDLDTVNAHLAEWAARSAVTSEALIDRFEAMGYDVRGKSEEDIADVLRRPPTRPAR